MPSKRATRGGTIPDTPKAEENPKITALWNLIELQRRQINQLLARQANNNNHEGQISNQDRTNNQGQNKNHATAREGKATTLKSLFERFQK